MNRPRSFASARSLPLVSIVFLAACSSASEGAAPTGPAPTPEVSVVTVRSEPLAVADDLPGRVAAFRVAEVRPQVGGIVRQRRFTEGEVVRAGQALYQIDTAPFRAEVASASATLERGRAVLAQAEIHERRTASLFETGAATQQALDEARASLALARAEVAQALAALERRRLDLRYATISAPIDGRIGISRISEGALVGPADPEPLAIIQQIDQVYVDIRQPADRADAFVAGAEAGEGGAEVTLLSQTGEPYAERGRVLFSDISVDPGTGETTIRALVPNPDARLLPGMYVRAQLARGEVPDALLVPQQAVQRTPTGDAQVLVVGAEEKLEARPIVLGRVIAGRAVVARGLEAGDRVVVEGHDRLAPGTAVRADEWRAAAAAPAEAAGR